MGLAIFFLFEICPICFAIPIGQVRYLQRQFSTIKNIARLKWKRNFPNKPETANILASYETSCTVTYSHFKWHKNHAGYMSLYRLPGGRRCISLLYFQLRDTCSSNVVSQVIRNFGSSLRAFLFPRHLVDPCLHKKSHSSFITRFRNQLIFPTAQDLKMFILFFRSLFPPFFSELTEIWYTTMFAVCKVCWRC